KWQYADKTRLVIFGEYVPFRDRLGFLGGFNLPAGDLQPGSEVTTLEVGGIRVGSLLCFEALFEEVAREHAANGAELLAVMSLDDWYQRTGAIEMLKAAAVLRAVENRLPVVRSAPLGPSLIVDERGRILAEAAVGETTAVRAEVTLAPSRPFRLRYVFPWLALGVWLLFTLWRRAPTNASS
ncbi:MAG: hypothetical protein IH851_01825, partial [Armatimonadetes bacterium]|nr:hypothetical protein [Armatimonadota bacterium]